MSQTQSSGASISAAHTMTEIDTAAAVLRGRPLAVLTGAGVSTDSGIPDYRGAGAPVRTPMTFQQFLGDEKNRQRYWAGSHLGWRRFDAAQPNAGHRALAAMEASGIANGVITQNVDGLHVRAGSERVVDLHGTMSTVSCLHCAQVFARENIADRIGHDNPWLEAAANTEINPDGDALPAAFDSFITPACSVCGGILKPDVVFFGELVPVETFAEAAALIGAAEGMIVAGSSLVVNSGIRLIEIAKRRRIPLVVINRGATKGDKQAAVKIDAGTSETLSALLERLTE